MIILLLDYFNYNVWRNVYLKLMFKINVFYKFYKPAVKAWAAPQDRNTGLHEASWSYFLHLVSRHFTSCISETV